MNNQDRSYGVVKWYNPQKGFGFIIPDNGSRDIFVHVNQLDKSGLKGLDDGQRISFTLGESRGKTQAENIRTE